MLIPYVPQCTITPTAEISAVRDDSESHLTEYRIELPEIDHGFGEGRFDTALLENRHIDVSVRSITGAEIEQSPLLQAANRAMSKWWATTPIGRRLDIDALLRELRHEERRSGLQKLGSFRR